MNAVTATFKIGEDSAVLLAEILRHFPKGIQVKLAVSEVPQPDAVPDLEEYRRILDAARRQAPPLPWRTTDEAMRALREGEAE